MVDDDFDDRKIGIYIFFLIFSKSGINSLCTDVVGDSKKKNSTTKSFLLWCHLLSFFI